MHLFINMLRYVFLEYDAILFLYLLEIRMQKSIPVSICISDVLYYLHVDISFYCVITFSWKQRSSELTP